MAARYLVAAWLLAASCITGAKAAIITGVARDAQGNPLDGAQIKVICEQYPDKSARVLSGKDGTYRFDQLLPCKYLLSAERNGLGVATPAVIDLPATSSSVVVDLTLSKALQNGDVAKSQPHLKFEAAGIRGLIDPGGYSAPANAAAASGLISGVADIRRMENDAELPTASDLPCTLESELTKTAKANPQNADANRRLGEFYLAHGSASQAILYLRRASQFDNIDSRIVRDLSEALLMTAQFDAARELLLTLPADQRDLIFHRLLARAEEGLGHFTQASEQYQMTADQDPSEENIFGVGYEQILAGRPADAAKTFRTGMVRYPLSTTLLIGAGTAEFLQGRSSTAVQLFLQAADLKPSDPRPYQFLAGAVGASEEQSEQVRASLKRHLELSPADAEARYLYALGLLHTRADQAAVNSDQVESLFKQAIALDPNLANAHFQLGTLYAHRDDYQSAAREFEATVRLAPGMKEAHYRLASAYKKTGNAEAAGREMKLFREGRESSTTQNPEGGISIEQFISVVDRPGHPSGKEMSCSENTIK